MCEFDGIEEFCLVPTVGHEARPCPGLLREEVDEFVIRARSDADDVEERNRG